MDEQGIVLPCKTLIDLYFEVVCKEEDFGGGYGSDLA